MLCHRQAIFKSKEDKLCSSAECRIWTRGPRHQIASRLNARWQTDWAIEDQAKNLNSTARPYDQRAFSPLDPTTSWLSHLAPAIYMFVVVNFDALAQASDIQIERRQVVFLCWMQDLNPGSQTPKWKHWDRFCGPFDGMEMQKRLQMIHPVRSFELKTVQQIQTLEFVLWTPSETYMCFTDEYYWTTYDMCMFELFQRCNPSRTPGPWPTELLGQPDWPHFYVHWGISAVKHGYLTIPWNHYMEWPWAFRDC